MSDTTSPTQGLEAWGISYKSAPIEVLERLALQPHEVGEFFERIGDAGRVNDVVLVSTCNRTEIYAAPESGVDIIEYLRNVLVDVLGRERFVSEGQFYRLSGREGLQHLFRVACGLDSLVLGEPQILGQLKDAYDTTVDHLTPSETFDKIMRSALKVGRKARASTDIGAGAVSVASAAVQLSRRIFSDLSKRCVVVVGAGETARLLAEHFTKHHPGKLVIINRTLSKAESLARSFGAEACSLDALPDWLSRADIVASAVQVDRPVIDRPTVQAAMHHRPGRPLALVDVGLPRNVDPSINELTDVFVSDIEALKGVVDANLSRRKEDVPRVEAFIHEEIGRLVDWQQTARIGPVIASLRDSVESIRRAEVDRVARSLSEAEREAVERATRAVVNKLLHGPMTFLKEPHKIPHATERIELLRHVFKNLPFDEE